MPGRTFFPNLSKWSTFAAAPLVLTPFVRNQLPSLGRRAASPSIAVRSLGALPAPEGGSRSGLPISEVSISEVCASATSRKCLSPKCVSVYLRSVYLRSVSISRSGICRSPMCVSPPARTLCLRPISLLTLSILTLLDSSFPGNPLWAWEFHPFKLRLCLSQTPWNPQC